MTDVRAEQTAPPAPGEPTFLLKASDPAAPFALLAYASAAHNKGMSDAYVSEVRTMAQDMYLWQDTHGVIAPGRAGVINEKIAAMFMGAPAVIKQMPDDHPLTQRMNAAIDRRIGERERDKRIPHPSGDDGGDGMAWMRDDT